ncbi:FAD-dependent oxidoreductase [uncultured Rhodoblastus sp.]|uniref:flavin monoamine oxidase family protein n=1 Tax=uncultured Rhodoblastus sp. TaxID=543037 RepID=UPI0025F436EE|nr:FAD-dependent oxidoreductase [uncultured Rhodoblastus sp.]
MIETAIVGGGLCGLALAAQLRRHGADFELYDARQRLGGRILTVDCKTSGLAIDLGASWFWPDNQPLIDGLLAELGLASYPQHDEGAALRLAEADKKPEKIEVSGGVHGGARKIAGGAQQVIDALARPLPAGRIHLGAVLERLSDGGDHVVLHFLQDGKPLVARARRVVLALPPRLVEERIAFEPALEESTRQAMREAPTWMASMAKAVATYDRPVWRETGQSGNAFVSHDQAVFDEIFDACDADGRQGALGGFLALGPQLRQSFEVGLPLLMQSQLEQVFGGDLVARESHFQDWATEIETCSARDRENGREEHNSAAHPMLRRALWAGKLYLGGSETAARQAGYMEGALEAARRISREFLRDTQDDAGVDATAGQKVPGEDVNAASLRKFTAWVAGQNDAAFDDYRRRLNALLAAQHKTQVTQMAMLATAEHIFAQALKRLEALPFELGGVAVEQGRCALTPLAQKPFGDFLRQFNADVVAFNATSCALSNFPDEHRLAREYQQAIFRDLAAAWTEFSLAANRLLLAKAENPVGAAS